VNNKRNDNSDGHLSVSRYRNDEDLMLQTEIFKLHLDGRTKKEIMEEKNLGMRAVTSYINKARATIYDELMEVGKKYYAEVWKKYDWLYEEARTQWDATRDPTFLKEMRACLEAIRRLGGLDSPPKAAVNENGQAVGDRLVLVMSEDAYLQKEREAKMLNDPNIIEGEVVKQ
jgi:hypothetical protein